MSQHENKSDEDLKKLSPISQHEIKSDEDLSKIDNDISFHRIMIFFVLLVTIIFYMILINFNAETSAASWGPVGDFFGGILNPIFALFAFYWLTYSVRLQIKELKETREELGRATKAQEESAKHQEKIAKLEKENIKTQVEILNLNKATLKSQQDAAISQQKQISKQNFENLFFELIKTKNEALKEINTSVGIPGSKTTIYGTQALKNILSIFTQSRKNLTTYYPENISHKLSSYRRICENILELILSSKKEISSGLMYENIFTSTLTQLELSFLFYCGIFNKRLKYLLEEFSALVALDYYDDDCGINTVSNIKKYAFLYRSEVFGDNIEWSEYFKDFENCNFKNIEINEFKIYKKYILDNFNLKKFNDERKLEFISFDEVEDEIKNKIIKLNLAIKDKGIKLANNDFQQVSDIEIDKLKNELDRLEKFNLKHELYVTIKYDLDISETLRIMKNF